MVAPSAIATRPQPGNFNLNTRQKRFPITSVNAPSPTVSTLTHVGGNVSVFNIPHAGYLQGLVLTVRGNVGTAPTGTLNAQGFCSLINRIRLTLSIGVDLHSFSGPGYHYLIAPQLDNVFNPFAIVPAGITSGPTAAWTTGTFAVDFYIPIAPNFRDPLSLLALENRSLNAVLYVEWATAAAISSTNATIYASGGIPVCQVNEAVFTVPIQAKDQPDDTWFHSIIEEQTQVATAGDFAYSWLLGTTYMQMLHGVTLGLSSAGLDKLAFSDVSWQPANGTLGQGSPTYKLRVTGSDNIIQVSPSDLDVINQTLVGSRRLAGTIPINFMASAGLGMYDQARDIIMSGNYSDINSVITLINACVVYNIRRVGIPIPKTGG